MAGKTIQIYLPEGDPRGLRLADMTSRTVLVIEIPRTAMGAAGDRKELASVGVYLLVGDDEETGGERVYVGEGEDCLASLRQHHAGKDFWRAALVAVSKTGYLTKTHTRYLQWRCHGAIGHACRYVLENTNEPSRPHVSEAAAADLEGNFETLGVLVSTLDYPVFERLATPDGANVLTESPRGCRRLHLVERLGIMDKQPQPYSSEVRGRAVRMVLEHQSEYASQWAAIGASP